VGRYTHRYVHVDGLAKQVWNEAVSAIVTATTTELNAGESKSSATRKTAVAAAPLLLIGKFLAPDWERQTLPRDSIGDSIGAPLVSPRANLKMASPPSSANTNAEKRRVQCTTALLDLPVLEVVQSMKLMIWVLIMDRGAISSSSSAAIGRDGAAVDSTMPPMVKKAVMRGGKGANKPNEKKSRTTADGVGVTELTVRSVFASVLDVTMFSNIPNMSARWCVAKLLSSRCVEDGEGQAKLTTSTTSLVKTSGSRQTAVAE